VILDQQAVDDERLSWAARGLLLYLLARPDDWKVLVKDLQRRGDLKRDGIYKLLKELRNTGYAQYVSIRDEQGRIRGGVYYIYEQPLPHPDMPDPALPDTAVPSPAKPEVLLTTDKDLIRTTTTTPTTTNHRHQFPETRPDSIEFAPWVPEELKSSAVHLVKELEPSLAQLVIDEWAGLLEEGAIHTSPHGYLHTLVKRLQAGEFTPKYAAWVAAIRRGEKMEQD
jgi:hypothetical protein